MKKKKVKKYKTKSTTESINNKVDFENIQWGTVYSNLLIGFDLDSNSYLVLESVYHLSKNAEYNYWCYQSKEALSKRYNIKRLAVQRIVSKLTERGLIEHGGEGGRGLRPCKQFIEAMEKTIEKRSVSKRHNTASNEYNQSESQKTEQKTVSKGYSEVSNGYNEVSNGYTPEKTPVSNEHKDSILKIQDEYPKDTPQSIERIHNININKDNINTGKTWAEISKLFDGRKENPARRFHFPSGNSLEEFGKMIKEHVMALLNDEIKGSEFFNKRTGYLMVLWLKERFKALNSYAISNEKKLEHLKLFHEFDKQYSYRVIAYAIHEYGKNGGFKEYGGTLKDFSLQKELVSAFNKCIQMCESGYPKVYDPDIKEFKRIPQNWDGHIYVEKIKEYGLKTGDVVHESKKGEFDE